MSCDGNTLKMHTAQAMYCYGSAQGSCVVVVVFV